MFSRAAKSVVKTFGPRNYHGSEDKLKVTVIQAAGEISQTLSQLLKGKSKCNHLAIQNVIRFPCPARNECKTLSFEDDEQLCHSVNNPQQVRTLTADKMQTRSMGAALSSRESGDCQAGTKDQDSFVTYFTSQEQDSEKIIPELGTSELKFISEIRDQHVASERSEVERLAALELSELRDSELVDVSRSLPAVRKLGARNQQLVPIEIDELMPSTGISKQAVQTWSNVHSSSRILGEMGPSVHTRRDDLHKWFFECTECKPLVENTNTDFVGCSYRTPLKRKRKLVKKICKKRNVNRKNGSNDYQPKVLLSSVVTSRQNSRSVKCRRKEQVGLKNVATKTNGFQSTNVVVKINRQDNRRGTRFLGDLQNWTVPAILTNKKPNLLHDFKGGKTKLKKKCSSLPLDFFRDDRRGLKTCVTKKEKNSVVGRKLGNCSQFVVGNGGNSNFVKQRNCEIKKLTGEPVTSRLMSLDYASLEPKPCSKLTSRKRKVGNKSLICNQQFKACLKSEAAENVTGKEMGRTIVNESQLFLKREFSEIRRPKSSVSASTIESFNLDRLFENAEVIEFPDNFDDLRMLSPCESSKDQKTKTAGSCKKSKKVDPCKKEEKKDPCKKSKDENPCKKQKEKDPCKKQKEKDPCKKEKEDPCKKLKKKDSCQKPKKEDPCKKTQEDCPEIKKVEPCEKHKCPEVIKAPTCPSKQGNKKSCIGCLTQGLHCIHVQNKFLYKRATEPKTF